MGLDWLNGQIGLGETTINELSGLWYGLACELSETGLVLEIYANVSGHEYVTYKFSIMSSGPRRIRISPF